VTAVPTDTGSRPAAPLAARPLAERTLAELWELFPITLREYDSRYPTWFAEEAAHLAALFPGSVFRLSHIGSTAVPGLTSKPTIDMLLELGPDCPPAAIVARLTAAGWNLMATSDDPLRLDFNKGYTPTGFAERVFHLHVVRPGDHDELYFRDLLRHDAATRRDYVQLKRGLAREFEHDRDAYTAGKTTFVRAATIRARAQFPGRYSAGDELSPSQTL